MRGQSGNSVTQKVTARKDARVAGRDSISVTVNAADASDLVPPGLLPRDVPQFTGRENELRRLAALAAGGQVVVTAIGGTAGVGKTALAVHAAHQLLPKFPDGHLYADLRGYTAGQAPAEPGEILDMFLRRLGVPAEEIPSAIDERAGVLRGLLAGRRVLVLLDNARSEAQVRPLLPGAGASLVLVTSRSVLPGLEVNERISLDILSDEDTGALLADIIGAARAVAEPESVSLVAHWCGHLPLALRIAGQILVTHPAWPVSRLERMLADERQRLASLSVGDLQVRAAFEVSYRQLQPPDARMFRRLGLHPSPSFDTASAAALTGVQDRRTYLALERLAQACLITEDDAGRYGMHDLLRLFARDTCERLDNEATRDAALDRIIRYYVDLAGSLNSRLEARPVPARDQAPDSLSESRETPRAVRPTWTRYYWDLVRSLDFQLNPPQVVGGEQGTDLLSGNRETLQAFEVARPGFLAVADLAAERGEDTLVWQLSQSCDNALGILRHLDDSLRLHEAAVAAARRAGNSDAEGTALFDLAMTYRSLGRLDEAIGCLQRAVVIQQETGSRNSEGATIDGLGIVYGDMGRPDEAIACHRQAMVIHQETGQRVNEGRSLQNLGTVYHRERRFDEAITCYKQAIEIFRQVGDRRSEGIALDNLGVIYAANRHFADAISFYEDALACYREAGDRYREGLLWASTASAHANLFQRSQTAACLTEAAAAMREVGEMDEAARLERAASDATTSWFRWIRSLRRL